ncbi:MAG: polyprenol monophosphomannose synthase [Deltaproteobacteria bacterium]|nr:polyprenol monophosphomannose synthase [Deltaproteobacteria bacterium]
MRAMAMVPTYNEAPNIEALLREILAQGPDIGAVVVDDDSPDGTGAIVEGLRREDPRVHLIRRRGERGRGTAGVAGFRYAAGQGVEYVIEMDADFSHPPSCISDFLSRMGDCDLLIGSRLVPGGGERGRHFLRKWITRAANFYIRQILQLPVRDCTSGFRVFRREVLQAIELDQIVSRGPSVVEEVLYQCYRRGFRIREVPYVLEERQAGQSTFNLRIMLEAMKMIVKIRWRYRRYPHS